jgi:multiple sugar transport system substrate-binding protein
MSRLNRRQFLQATGASFVASAVLAACAPQAAQPAGEAAPASEGITLTIMHVHPLYESFGASTVDPQFMEKNAGVTIERQLIPGWINEYYPKLSAMTAAGEVFDAAQLPHAAILYALFTKGVFKELDPFMQAEGFDMEKYFKPCIEGAKHPSGATFMLPLLVDDGQSVLLYNKDVLANAGLEEPKPGAEWTWDEYAEWATQVNDSLTDIVPVYNEWHNWYAIESLLHAWGDSRFLDDEGRTCLIDQEKPLACQQFFVATQQEGGWNAKPSELGGFFRDLYMGGTVAVCSDFYPTAVTAKNNPDLKFEPGAVHLPKGPGEDGLVPGIGNMHFFGMGGNSAHPDEAWAYMKFYGGEELAEPMWTAGLPLPIKSVWTGEWVEDSLTAEVLSTLDTIRPPTLPWNYRSNEISDAYGQNMTAVIEGTVPFEQGLAAALDAITAVLEKPEA